MQTVCASSTADRLSGCPSVTDAAQLKQWQEQLPQCMPQQLEGNLKVLACCGSALACSWALAVTVVPCHRETRAPRAGCQPFKWPTKLWHRLMNFVIIA